jgi:hypothetical protein
MLFPVMEREVKKLLDDQIIVPLRYSEWVANLVPVRKKSGEIRLCVDFRNLNRSSKKDNYPLPKMEHILQRVTGASRISMIDGFSGYNQILFLPEDKEKDNLHHSLGYIHVCQNSLWIDECRGNFSASHGHSLHWGEGSFCGDLSG